MMVLSAEEEWSLWQATFKSGTHPLENNVPLPIKE